MVMYETARAVEGKQMNMDKPEETAFCTAFEKLPQAQEGTVRLFDRKDYYTAHGEDAKYIAATVYKTNTVLRYLGPKKGHDEGLPSCTLSMATATSFLREALTARQLRIEIYAREGGKGAWKADKKASPGNLSDVEDLLFGSVDILTSPVVAAITCSTKASVITVGVALTDSSERHLGIAEFVDNELFSNVESFIIQQGIKEVLLPAEGDSKSPETQKLRATVERCGVVITERKKADFKTANIEQDLQRLLKESDQPSLCAKLELKLAMACANALLSYLTLLEDEANEGVYTLLHHDLGQFLRLDASALRALHIMPDFSGLGGSGRNMSLFSVLNHCKTAQGTRLLAQWLKQPLTNVHQIRKRQDLVEAFVEAPLLRQTLRNDNLRMIPDLSRLAKKLEKGKANLQDVARVYQAVLRLNVIVEALREGEFDTEAHKSAVDEEFVQPLTGYSNALAKYSEMVETTLDLEELDNNRYVIQAAFQPDLESLKTQLDKVKAGMDEDFEQTAEDLGFSTDGKTLHFEPHTTYGWTYRLTRKEASVISKKSKYISLMTKTNGTLFTTKTLRGLVSEHKDMQAKYDKKQNALVKEVVAIAASYSGVFLPLNDALAKLDLLTDFAEVAVTAPTAYVRPTLTPKGEGNVTLKEARHPCLELQEEINFIPNDVEMVRGQREFSIITGPNMGGKSTFIRQLGTTALMAQIGSFVACTEAELPVFDAIFARVGAGDYQLKGVSTFMAEMLETASILKSATRDSLVIIDELGRGTSTWDGFGLAWSISEHIATDIHCFTLFASHFHELTVLADQIPHVNNLHVMAQVEDKSDSVTGRGITLLYKVEPGSCDQSFGIQVAELADFPTEVVRLAKRKVEDLEELEAPAAEMASGGAAAQCTPEEVAQGTEALKKFLLDWSQSKGDEGDGGSMDDTERQVKRLKTCYEEHRAEVEANPWCKALLAEQ